MPHLRKNLFIELPMTFGEIDEKTLLAIRDRLIQRHRNHQGFSITKDNQIECDECEFSAEETHKGYLAMTGNIISWIVGVDITPQEVDWIARMSHAKRKDE